MSLRASRFGQVSRAAVRPTPIPPRLRRPRRRGWRRLNAWAARQAPLPVIAVAGALLAGAVCGAASLGPRDATPSARAADAAPRADVAGLPTALKRWL